MTKKISDFLNFINYIKSMGYRSQIHITHLEYFIAEKFGTSKYLMTSTLDLLIKFGFLKQSGMGVFEVCDGWHPIQAEKDIKEAEEKAAAEVDDLMEKVKKSEPE